MKYRLPLTLKEIMITNVSVKFAFVTIPITDVHWDNIEKDKKWKPWINKISFLIKQKNLICGMQEIISSSIKWWIQIQPSIRQSSLKKKPTCLKNSWNKFWRKITLMVISKIYSVIKITFQTMHSIITKMGIMETDLIKEVKMEIILKEKDLIKME